MKMARRVVVVVGAIILVLLLGCGWIMFRGKAGSPHAISSIRFKTFYSETEIEIPLSYKKGGNWGGVDSSIYTNESGTELAAKLDGLPVKTGVLSATAYPNGSILLLVKERDQIQDISAAIQFSQRKVPDYSFYYTFSSSSAYLDTTGYSICWPYHLMATSSPDFSILHFSTDYATDYSPQDFLDFYKLLADCYSLPDKDRLKLSGNVLDIPSSFLQGEPDPAKANNPQGIRLIFQSKNDQTYVSVQVNQRHEAD